MKESISGKVGTIYKYLNYDRVASILQNKTITLSKIESWEDVYENWILKSEVLPSSIGIEDDSKTYYYGICWSFSGISDAMWRIYSPEKTGVRLKTNIDKLVECISEQFNNIQLFTIRSKAVKYFSFRDLKASIKEKINSINVDYNEIVMDSLFMKRNCFSHEQEYRVILKSKNKLLEEYPQVNIDINNVIDTILFDPRIPDMDFHKRKEELKAFGYKKRINRSTLYTFKKINLNNI